MLSWFSSRRLSRRTADQIYGVVVTQARAPAFYGAGRVQDTPEGRAELLLLHLVLVLDRLSAIGGPTADALARHLSEAFVVDFDDSLREMGVGDLSVPKKVKRAAAALFERGRAYRAPLATANLEQLAAALEAAFEPVAAPGTGRRLAPYVTACHQALARLSEADLEAGRLSFPNAELALGGSPP